MYNESFFSSPSQPPDGWNGAQWIGEQPDLAAPAKNCPRLRKAFALETKKIERASVSVCGLGFYELYLNGRKADASRILAPGWSNPKVRLLFDTYDVTSILRPGANRIGLWLAPGYSDDFSQWGWRWEKSKRAILCLTVDYADGTTQTVISDASWELKQDGPILFASIYHGEIFDASREDSAWCAPEGGREGGWNPVSVVDAPSVPLVANDAPPVRVGQPLAPVSLTRVNNTSVIADFGQNRAGIVRIRAKGSRGTAIRLRYAEELDDSGRLDLFTARGARSEDVFVLAGTGAEEVYEPRFTYHGFCYVEIFGYPGELVPEAIVSLAVHADLEPTGSFACSNDMLNRLFSAAKWSMLSNFMSYPTDCPMRDERTPCQMDSQVYEDAACQFFQMDRYYTKWIDDIREEPLNPNPDWRGDLVTLPWRLYSYYGDQKVLAQTYDDMRNLALSFRERTPDGIWREGFGDWCPPNDGRGEHFRADLKLVNTALLVEIWRIIAASAAVLGKKADAERFDAYWNEQRSVFLSAFHDPGDGTFGSGSQTALIIPLALGLVPEEGRAATVRALERRIRHVDFSHICTGIFGTRYFGDVLCDNGLENLWLETLRQTDEPSFGYMFSHGATTLWEQWAWKGGMHSHCHAMMSGAASALFTHLCGIRPAEPGYAKITIKPVFPKGIDWAEAVRKTPRGTCRVRWKRKEDGIYLDIELPPRTSSELHLPSRPPQPLSGPQHSIRLPGNAPISEPEDH